MGANAMMMSALLAGKKSTPIADPNLLDGFAYIAPTGDINQIALNVYQYAAGTDYKHNGVDTGLIIPIGGEIAWKAANTNGAYDACFYIVLDSAKNGDHTGMAIGTDEAFYYIRENGSSSSEWYTVEGLTIDDGDYVSVKRSAADQIQLLISKNNGLTWTVIDQGPISESITGFNGSQSLRFMGYIGNVLYYPQVRGFVIQNWTLTVNVTGTTDYKVFINNVEMSGTFEFPNNTVLSSVKIVKEGWAFSPAEVTNLTMDGDKVLNFTATEIETRTLTINVTGTTDYAVYINEMLVSGDIHILPKDGTYAIRLSKAGWKFTPTSVIGLVLDDNKSVSFTAEVQTENILVVGNGSGDIVLNGAGTTYDAYNVIEIVAGEYGYLEILNFNRSDDPITIRNQGQVWLYEMDISNVKGVSLIGNGDTNIQHGFKMEGHYHRPVSLSGVLHDLTMSNISIVDAADYVISYNGTLNYNGTKDTRLDNIKILNSHFSGVMYGAFRVEGVINSSTDTNFIRGFEFENNTITDSPNGYSVVYISNAAQYNIHHNVVDNFNVGLTNHNGVFWLHGSGEFHNNKLTTYQGNALRAWAFNRLEFPSQVKAYNNIGYNSIYYSLFEIQGFEDRFIAGKTEMVTSEIYNNTGVQLDTSRNWCGLICDLYPNIGFTNLYNNLGAKMYTVSTAEATDTTMNNGTGGGLTQTNNRYFSNPLDAVEDLVTFKSKIPGVGAGEI